ncbi:DUF2815 family protein [Paenibacillus sp. P26]|nr:DUF2815 family protein [Paenibacillus sp. P26]UUZ96018.1 DUF2815 family protein [Paenibacillus sp. P25]
MTQNNDATRVITGKVRLSYAKIWEPEEDKQGNPWYGTSVLIPKEDKDTVRKIKAAVDAAKEQGKSLWGGKIPGSLKTPLRDGDEERPDDDAYRGHYFLNCKSKNKPGIAKPVGKTPDGKTKFQEITDTTEVYSGCYVKISLNFYPFSGESRGVAVGLNNIVKIQDGEPLGSSRVAVDDEFADEDFDDVVDISDDDEDFMN